MNFNSGGAVEAGFLPQLEGPTQTGGGREVMCELSLSPFFVSVARVVFRCLCIHGRPADPGW